MTQSRAQAQDGRSGTCPRCMHRCMHRTRIGGTSGTTEPHNQAESAWLQGFRWARLDSNRRCVSEARGVTTFAETATVLRRCTPAPRKRSSFALFASRHSCDHSRFRIASTASCAPTRLKWPWYDWSSGLPASVQKRGARAGCGVSGAPRASGRRARPCRAWHRDHACPREPMDASRQRWSPSRGIRRAPHELRDAPHHGHERELHAPPPVPLEGVIALIAFWSLLRVGAKAIHHVIDLLLRIRFA